MKKLKTILLFSFVFGLHQSVFTQKWCEPGTEWIMSENYDYMRYHYQKDTIYEGVPCKKIQALRINPDQCKDTVAIENKSIYTYAQNDTVWFYHEDAFYPTYFFNAQVGDTLVVKNFMPFTTTNCDSTLTQIVDSIGTTTFYGDTLRFYMYTFRPREFNWDIRTFVIEKLGTGYLPMSNFSFGESLQPYHACLADVKRVRTLCYNDSSFSFREDPNKDCSACLPMGLEKNTNESSPYSIYPNPAENWITIVGGESGKKNYRITSLDGKLVLEGTLPSGNTESRIDLKHITSGVYLITLIEEKGVSFTHKIVIK